MLYTTYFAYISESQPNYESLLNRLEEFNELCLIAVHYTMLFYLYGSFVKPEVQKTVGYATVGIIVVIFIANFAYLLYTIISKACY